MNPNPPAAFPFYPLANPKGTEYKCEICERPAYLQCSLCRVTYYCGTEHQKIDWVGIHERICTSLMSLRKPVPFIASEDERRKVHNEIQERKVDMIAMTRLIGQKLLFEEKYEEAVPAALQCLKFTSDAYGLASVELILPYLILAESSIGLGRLCQAEAYLSQAQWTLLKLKHDCSNAIRSQLNRKLGLLYAAKGEMDAALESLAKDIFYASCEYGTDHIATAGGYFQMGEVFATLHKQELEALEASSKSKNYSLPVLVGPSATPYTRFSSSSDNASAIYDCRAPLPSCKDILSAATKPIKMPKDKYAVADTLFARVVNIWADHLAGIVKSMTYKPEIPEGIGAVVAEITQEKVETLNDAQAAEVQKVLRAIERYRHQRLVKDGVKQMAHTLGTPDPKVRLLLAQAMLQFVLGKKMKASQYFSDAKVANEFAMPHEKIKADMEVMSMALEERKKVSCSEAD